MRKIRQSDRVEVITGEHRGMRGEVLRVDTKGERAVVQGVNFVRVHQRRTRNRDAGIIEREAPLHLSNLALVCPACDKPSRVGITQTADGRRVRFCKKCNEIIE